MIERIVPHGIQAICHMFRLVNAIVVEVDDDVRVTQPVEVFLYVVSGEERDRSRRVPSNVTYFTEHTNNYLRQEFGVAGGHTETSASAS